MKFKMKIIVTLDKKKIENISFIIWALGGVHGDIIWLPLFVDDAAAQ